MIRAIQGFIKTNVFYLLFVAVFPVFYCSILYTTGYYKLHFIISYVKMLLFMAIIAFWISFIVRRVYYPICCWAIVLFTSLIAKILFTISPHFELAYNVNLIQAYLWKRYPFLLLIIILFTFWLKKNPNKNLCLFKSNEYPFQEPYLDLFSIYDHLIRKTYASDYVTKKNFQLFDIVFIYVKSKKATIYLRNGAKIECENIVEILRGMALMSWLVKINQNCYINVMHIHYPHYMMGRYLCLQPKTFQSMSKKHLSKMEVNKLCQFGSSLMDRNIKMVLNNKSDLDYRGEWNVLIPLN